MVKLNGTGSALAYATFLGGSNWDGGYAIAADGSGAAYVTGDTRSFDFPTTPGAFDTTHNGGGYDAFVAKLAVGGGGPAGTASFTAIHPSHDSVPSTVMQDGVAHRYYTLRDVNTGDLIPNATITLSAGGEGQSDANGIVDLALYADTLAGPDPLPLTRTVSVTGVWVGGARYDVLSPPTFQVGIHPRPFTHEWSGGTVRKAKGGVSAGLGARRGGGVLRRPGPRAGRAVRRVEERKDSGRSVRAIAGKGSSRRRPVSKSSGQGILAGGGR